MRLNDKVALITGGASGIGKEIAEAFAREGARVAIADNNGSDADVTAKTLQAKGWTALGVSMDVTEEDQVTMGINSIVKSLGPIDILVSNAGVQYISPIETLAFSEWQKLISIDLDGAFLTTQACLRGMIARGKGGSIIYIGSIYSKIAGLYNAPYVTAKHGLIGLCKVVAKEGAKHNIHANVLCPGFVHTPMLDKEIIDQSRSFGISEKQVIQDLMLKDTVDGKFTSLGDVSEVAIFLATFKTNALTGQTIMVNHGHTM